jgi:drug/metabolite transporter (DMT)-like permease
MKQRDGSMYIFIAAVMWSFGGLAAKVLTWNAFSIACIRGLIAFIVILIYRGRTKISFSKSTILSAISLTLTTTLFMLANKLTTSANAIVLQYSAPVFILIFSVIFEKIKPSYKDLVAVAFTLFGISLFFIDRLQTGNWFGDFIGVLSGVSFAGVFFANKLPNANPMDASLLGNLFSIFLVPFLFFDQNFLTFSPMNWSVILLMGTFQLGIPYILFSLGIKKTKAVKSSIIATIEPILNPIWVFLFIGELPGILSLIGGSIVLLTIAIYNVTKTKENYKFNGGVT